MRVARQRGSPPPWMLLIALIVWPAGAAMAENIDHVSKYAWGENIGWLNAEPQGEGGPGVTVGDTALTGWIWGENIGWVSLSCQNTSSCGANDYGVVNDGLGVLSGHAWAENVGWISFSCANTGTCGTANYGVTIDPFTGDFDGQAWGENVGWIRFASSGPNPFAVVTSWRCPDPDSDSVCSAGDNCATWANPSQGTVLFQETVQANATVFFWPTVASVFVVRGEFNSPADIGNYVVTADGSFTTDSFSDVSPSPGTGYWYLVRPDCEAGSYSTGSPSELGDRDGALLP